MKSKVRLYPVMVGLIRVLAVAIAKQTTTNIEQLSS